MTDEDGEMKERQRWLCCLFGALVWFPWLAKAATVTVKVTVTKPPACVLNDNQPIVVQFNEVMTTRVDGNNYRQRVIYTLSCGSDSANAMKIRIKQEPGASFDSNVLRTNKTGLGIALLQGGNRRAINSWLNFTYPNMPLLEVVPVKQAGVKLSGGVFTAGATLEMAYQ
ncbi:fimbrial protein [Serratia sp. (in: enterobacteria)]|uniref:fimbrial protein n=1 Tax=Serratia sp. (in: enterobacteria) TaxID=616 RepID=UPI003988CA94